MEEERRKRSALNIEVLLVCIRASTIEYENSNINMEENKKDGRKGSIGTECCLFKIEKLTVPARVVLLQSTNIWFSASGASVHYVNNRCRGSNTCKGSGTCTIGAHDDAMMACSIMDIIAMLKEVQYNPKSNFNLSSIGKTIKEGSKLSGNQEGLVLMKDNVKLVFDNKIMTENSLIFCAYLQREYEIAVTLASTSITMSIEKAHMMTGYHDEEQICMIEMELGWPLKKGPMMPCKACSIGKLRQLVVNKPVDNSKKAMRAGERIFSNLAMIKAP